MSDEINKKRLEWQASVNTKIEALEKKLENLTPFKANDIELLFNTRKEIAELKVGSARQTEEHKALDDIYRFMFEKCAMNLEKMESVLNEFMDDVLKTLAGCVDEPSWKYLNTQNAKRHKKLSSEARSK